MVAMRHPLSRAPPPRLSGRPLPGSMRWSTSLTPSPARGRARMAGLPSGTVTFLFTDIEGSTALWERDPAAMRTAVARHFVLLQNAITAHGGVLFKTVGDAAHAAFGSAAGAVVAAVDAQQALHAEPWALPEPLRVRMALHTGEVTPVDGDYAAPVLNRLARLLAIGHGGQVLLAGTTQQLVRGGLPPGTELRDLSE